MMKKKDHIDPLTQALSDCSGLPASEHTHDADLIFATTLLKLQDPEKSKERASRIRRAATEIDKAIAALSPGVERSTFDAEFQKALRQRREDPDRLGDFIEALKAGATALEEIADEDLAKLPHSRNANRINIEIATVLAEIYVRITGKDPPRAGTKGPFQRLLHDVYSALGRYDVDLRGPLQKVHEYRKNRHSCL